MPWKEQSMLPTEKEFELISGGDCFSHWHSSDRVRTHDDSVQLDALESYQTVADGTHNVKPGVTYVLVDTSAGSTTLYLPNPERKLSVTVIKTSASNTLTVDSTVGNINGASTYSMTAAYAAAKFKAIDGNYYVVV